MRWLVGRERANPQVEEDDDVVFVRANPVKRTRAAIPRVKNEN